MKDVELTWQDPFERIWGFHVHQELPLEHFPKALSVQKQCAAFLSRAGVRIDHAEAIRPGYGPHLEYLWELRVESDPVDILAKLGLAISFLAVNRFGLSGYVHALMHDRSLPDDLEDEGRTNQANVLWFGLRVAQNGDFFFNPPRDEQKQIVDTRTTRVLPDGLRAEMLAFGEHELPPTRFRDPADVIVNGFHIHLDYLPPEKPLAMTVFDRFLSFLLAQGLRPTSTRLYAPGENGPHVQAGWEVKFETPRPETLKEIGIALGWLMCNRQNLSVSVHPVTWKPGDLGEELRAHEDYWMFIGSLPELDLGFFREQLLPRHVR